MSPSADRLAPTWTVLVAFEIRSPTTMPQWLDVWAPRGVDALTGEPQTTAYAAMTAAGHGDKNLPELADFIAETNGLPPTGDLKD